MSPSADNMKVQALAGRAFVLDDEPHIAALICRVLQGLGFVARQFTSPGLFLEELRKSAPDLILLDLSLGQSDAVEVIRHLDCSGYQGRVMLISGRDEETLNAITQIGENHGLAMLPPLQKPFRPADIKERLRSSTAPAATAKWCSPVGSSQTSEVRVSINEALRSNWLELWYQPKIDLKSFSCSGAEGLVRARHPEHGVIMPAQLLPPAGDADYQPLTRFVVERAMADWRRFAQQGLYLNLAVNAPASVIHMPEFIALVRSVLPSHPKFPGLTVEVTEDEIIRDGERAREIATQLKLYNVGLSIDDFGSGYASLSRLNDLPFVEVKIDRAFVSGCSSNQVKRDLCKTVIDLGHRFGAKVCAEGVETIEDLRTLVAMGCDQAQGFLFARPMPAEQLAASALAGAAKPVAAALQQPVGPKLRLAQTA